MLIQIERSYKLLELFNILYKFHNLSNFEGTNRKMEIKNQNWFV